MQGFEHILQDLPRIQEAAASLQEILLSNLVMIGEIPSPTFSEEPRVRFLLDRFRECDLQKVSEDECGNALGILPGKSDTRNILLIAHVDTVFEESLDHTLSVQTDSISGPGVGDNAMGLAALLTLPALLEKLNIELDANLVMMGSTKSLGQGNLEGLSFFLENKSLPIESGICVEGVELGRLSYASIGMVRGKIRVSLPDEYEWTRFGAAGGILTMNEIINQINALPLPRNPKTSIIFGSIEGGKTFNTLCRNVVLRFEIRSESADMVTELANRIEEIAEETTFRTGADVALEIVARRRPGGLSFGHPMVRNTRKILDTLGLAPRVMPSMSELSACIEHNIPAVTIGLTHGIELAEQSETLHIPPMFVGMAQLLGLVLAMDRGFCNEH